MRSARSTTVCVLAFESQEQSVANVGAKTGLGAAGGYSIDLLVLVPPVSGEEELGGEEIV